jgi:hypothetical protein
MRSDLLGLDIKGESRKSSQGNGHRVPRHFFQVVCEAKSYSKRMKAFDFRLSTERCLDAQGTKSHLMPYFALPVLRRSDTGTPSMTGLATSWPVILSPVYLDVGIHFPD